MSIQHKLTKWLCVLWLGSVLPCTASTARAQDEDFGEDETPARTDAGDSAPTTGVTTPGRRPRTSGSTSSTYPNLV